MKKLDKKKLVQEFAESVIAQNSKIMEGDAKSGNKYAKKILDCYRKLSQIGNEGKDELSNLFNHYDLGVREMSAVFLLKYKTEEALTILRELSNLTGLIGFGAQEAIKRWEEGAWNLDE